MSPRLLADCKKTLRETGRRQLVLGLCTVNMMCAGAAYTQRQSSSFGRLTDLHLDYVPSGLALAPSALTHTNRIAVSSAHSAGLRFYLLRSDGSWKESGNASPVYSDW